MTIARINPSSVARKTLPGGDYGPGQTFNADVTLTAFELPVEPGKGPGWDRECKEDSYCKFVFKIDSETLGVQVVTDFQPLGDESGSKALTFLRQLGVTVTDSGEFDLDSVAPRKVAKLTLSEPRPNKRIEGAYYTGNVRDVVGI